jgi:hypothetical protein
MVKGEVGMPNAEGGVLKGEVGMVNAEGGTLKAEFGMGKGTRLEG